MKIKKLKGKKVYAQIAKTIQAQNNVLKLKIVSQESLDVYVNI